MQLKYHEYTLPNGVRVFMVPQKETRAAFIEVMFKIGSRYEKKSEIGISHFLEHMAFKGTKRRPTPIAISKEIDEVGGSNNAYTGEDITSYWIRMPAKKLELAIDILSDMLLNSKFEKKEVEKERRVISEELKMIHDNPYRFSSVKYQELVYGGSAIGRPIDDEEKNVKKITRKNIIDFKNKYYRTNNVVIAIGGNINTKKTIDLLNKYFRRLKGEIEDKYEKVNIKQSSPRIKIHKRDLKQVGVLIGFRSFGRNGNDQDRITRMILSRILGGYSSSILFEEIREKRGLAYDISSGVSVFDEVGDFSIGGGFAKEKLSEALESIFKILRKAKKDGFPAKDIKRAKENRIGKLLLSLDGASGWASNIADQALYEKRIQLPEETIKKINKVTNAHLKKMAKEVFQTANFNMVIVGPINPKEEKKYLDLIRL